MSNPIEAAASSRSWDESNVPDTHTSPSWWAPWERGKNSYQALKSARSRSTCSGNSAVGVTRSRGACSTIARFTPDWFSVSSSSSGSRAGSIIVAVALRSAASTSEPSSTACASPRPRTRWTSRHTSGTSWAIGSFACALCSQVAHGSDHASTRNVQSPAASARTHACQTSRPHGSTWTIGVLVSVPSGEVSTALAFTASWPSRNTRAVTGKSSPATAFAGYAPPSTTGETFVIGMRPSPRGGKPVTIASTGTLDIGPAGIGAGTGSGVTSSGAGVAAASGSVAPVAGRVDLAIGVLLAVCFTSLTYLVEPYRPEALREAECRCGRPVSAALLWDRVTYQGVLADP